MLEPAVFHDLMFRWLYVIATLIGIVSAIVSLLVHFYKYKQEDASVSKQDPFVRRHFGSSTIVAVVLIQLPIIVSILEGNRSLYRQIQSTNVCRLNREAIDLSLEIRDGDNMTGLLTLPRNESDQSFHVACPTVVAHPSDLPLYYLWDDGKIICPFHSASRDESASVSYAGNVVLNGQIGEYQGPSLFVDGYIKTWQYILLEALGGVALIFALLSFRIRRQWLLRAAVLSFLLFMTVFNVVGGIIWIRLGKLFFIGA